MTQILVTLNEDATTLHVRKAIELLRGVVSTTVFKTDDSIEITLLTIYDKGEISSVTDKYIKWLVSLING